MLRDSLRIHTRSHHERIEQALDLPGSVRTRGDFERLLMRFYGFYVPHEARLSSYTFALDSYGIELHARLKADNIRRDLLSLGMSAEEISKLAQCVDLPDLRTPGHALGSLYVLEGSTLGSQVIERALKEKGHLGIMSAMRFLSGYGARTGTMWRSFVSALNTAQLGAEDISAAHEGAVQTFECLGRWMCRRGPEELPAWSLMSRPIPC